MIIGIDILTSASKAIKTLNPDHIYIVIDRQVADAHGSYLSPILSLTPDEHIYTLDGGEQVKTLMTAESLWTWLLGQGASRASLIVGIGGGALTDLCGFVASCYMRGIRTVNIPTTLLAMVDASVGGKTGVNLRHTKNVIGTFHLPSEVVCDIRLLDSLPIRELYSGYAEVLKTALLSGGELWQMVKHNPDPQYLLAEDWQRLIELCIAYKAEVVALDPHERTGTRRRLNLGHTIGHALEALSHERNPQSPLLHGEAVAIGLITELYIGVCLSNTPRELLRQVVYICRELYAPYLYTCKQYPRLIELMHQDKKNTHNRISIISLSNLGEPIDIEIPAPSLIKEALDFYRETFGN